MFSDKWPDTYWYDPFTTVTELMYSLWVQMIKVTALVLASSTRRDGGWVTTDLCETRTRSTRRSSSRRHGGGLNRSGAIREGNVRCESAGSVRTASLSKVTYEVDCPS